MACHQVVQHQEQFRARRTKCNATAWEQCLSIASPTRETRSAGRPEIQRFIGSLSLSMHRWTQQRHFLPQWRAMLELRDVRLRTPSTHHVPRTRLVTMSFLHQPSLRSRQMISEDQSWTGPKVLVMEEAHTRKCLSTHTHISTRPPRCTHLSHRTVAHQVRVRLQPLTPDGTQLIAIPLLIHSSMIYFFKSTNGIEHPTV